LILAAGLTPAWQQILRFDRLRLGEVNRAQESHWCASGKVLNVAVALAHLGAPVETLALLGGAAGDSIEREFAALGIARQWIQAHWATRVCTTVIDDSVGEVTELVENVGPVTADELERFRRAYAERAATAELVVLTGSLPSGTPRTFYRELLATTRSPAILDVRGVELREALHLRPLLVKPNREELRHTVGHALLDDSQVMAAMRDLNQAGAQWVLVTQGGQPALVSSPEGCYRITPPRVQPVNTIGAGDCLAAGIAWGVTQGLTVVEAICLGMAAAVENVIQLLPARLDCDAVRARARQVTVESI